MYLRLPSSGLDGGQHLVVINPGALDRDSAVTELELTTVLQGLFGRYAARQAWFGLVWMRNGT
jgi:hypothetical protein